MDIKISRKTKYPNKTSVNLCIVESHLKQNLLALLIFAVFMSGVLAFVHFVMMAQYKEIDRMESYYITENSLLSTLKEKNEVYGEVRAQYSHVGNGYLNDEETSEQDRLEILNIAEDKLLSAGALENISIEGNTATLIINNKKLANVSAIVASLEKNDIVEYATVTGSATDDRNALQTATDNNGQPLKVTSTMTIVFKDVLPEGVDESMADSTAGASAESMAGSTVGTAADSGAETDMAGQQEAENES